MAQVDVEDALARDQHQDEAKEQPPRETVGKVPILSTLLIPVDVGHGQHIQLNLPSTSSDVDREQDGPGNASPNEHDDHGHAKVSKEEVSIQRLVLESIGIWDLPERSNPVEPSCRKRFCTFPVSS